MNKYFAFLLAVAFLFIGFNSCETPATKTQTEKECADSLKNLKINPNGDSELALLMRKLYYDSDTLKQRLLNEEGTISEAYIHELERIHTATPTDPDVKTPEFDAYTKLMIQNAQSLLDSEGDAKVKFNNLVSQCVACHQSFCPGPVKKIKKLYF